ncbi:uncharacterized protein LOC111340925 [Stylophora pistillata]|uniref:uncharacterized protein LOC111340925 n=1 Tax=Stylophora pistillata TaxID=50429 RepID=UPI000C039930|nr:uncharacterized protein LOC111340925 [Stylophora pistillata]
MLSVGEVDLELDDDLGEEQHSYAWQDQGVLKQIQAESSGTETSQEQPSIIQEYVLLLCRFEAVTMLDYETLRFCLPKFGNSQHKFLEKSYICLHREEDPYNPWWRCLLALHM